MPQAALRVRHRQRERARGGAGIVVLPRERLGGVAIGGHAGGEREPHGGARRQPDALAKADDGIEHEAGRTRQRASVERRGIAGAAAPPQEARAIGFPFERPLRPASRLSAWNAHAAALAGIPRPPMAEQRGAVGEVLGLDEQLAERRMREVVDCGA